MAKFYIIKIRTFAITSLEQAKQLVYCQYRKRSKVSSVCPCQRDGGPTLNTLNLLLSISVVVHQPLCQRDGGPTLNTLDLDVAFYISSSTPTPFIFRFVFQHSVQRT